MRRFSILMAALALLPTALAARELHWRELAVRAELDAEGRLLVHERHTMVFTGDWNGGERTFRLDTGQRLELHGIDRVDPARGAIALVQGDLDEVDHWDWSDNRTVRWRSRLPTDPPFDGTELVYTLTYALSDILQPRGGGYELDHDFAFTDRVGVIERFVLDLELAPEWRPAHGFEGRLELADLQPGFGAPLTVSLDHAEDRPLAGVTRPLRPAWRHAALLAALAGMAAMFVAFLGRERALGRFEPADAPTALDPAWLETHVLSWLPEQVGALWDEKIGPPEVAAVIARLVAEGKLASSVERRGRVFKRHVLTLELLVDRGELGGYEDTLIRKLFFGKRRRVDTDALRKHYRTKGFDPAATIRPELERSIERCSPGSGGPRTPSYKRTLYLFVAAVVCGIAELVARPEPALSWGFLAFAVWFVLFWFGFSGARTWRRQVSDLSPRLLFIVVPGLVLAVAYWWLPTAFSSVALAPRHLGLLSLTLTVLGSFSFFVNQAATRAPRERLRLRQRLAVARGWWEAELDRESPALSDALLPYLVALGLERRIDRWFRTFGAAPTSSPAGQLGSSGTGTAITGTHWTGGGGAFGGAGATAAWTAAATGMAAGVSAASSSGGGGGGGGSSSSGGGGGGGW